MKKNDVFSDPNRSEQTDQAKKSKRSDDISGMAEMMDKKKRLNLSNISRLLDDEDEQSMKNGVDNLSEQSEVSLQHHEMI